MSSELARETAIATLHDLLSLHKTEEQRLRRLIVETDSPQVRLETIVDLERLIRQIKARWEELATLENEAEA